MRRLLPLLLAAAACARPHGGFVAGLLEPLSPRTAREARRLGLATFPRLPEGVALEDAAVPLPSGGERMSDHARLRFLAARAVVRGAPGVAFRLPAAPAGADLLDLPEEWQALARVARELRLTGPLLAGVPAPAPAAPPGVETRAWSAGGRRYVLLVNTGSAPAAFEREALAPWRALFEPRAAAFEALAPCGGRACLRPEGVLWLEGRPLEGGGP